MTVFVIVGGQPTTDDHNGGGNPEAGLAIGGINLERDVPQLINNVADLVDKNSMLEAKNSMLQAKVDRLDAKLSTKRVDNCKSLDLAFVQIRINANRVLGHDVYEVHVARRMFADLFQSS